MYPLSFRLAGFADRLGHYPRSYIDEILKTASDASIISFAGGLPDPALFPAQELSVSFQRALSLMPELSLQYNITEGYLPLRKFISERFSATHACDIGPEQVLITQGAQQALDIAGKAFINEGDAVITENPTFIGVLQAFAPYGPQYLPVGQQSDGIDTKALTRCLNAKRQPAVFYSMPRFQNPTGISYSGEKREDIINIMRDRAIWIIEDDAYGDLGFGDFYTRPFLCDLPDKSLYIGSFSKTIAPALRLGWIIAPRGVIDQLVMIKRAADTLSNFLTQVAVNDYLRSNDFDHHIRIISGIYARRMELMLDGIRNWFPAATRYTIPKGGMFTWATLPDEYDADKIAGQLLEEKIAVVPGRCFYPKLDHNNSFRINFSHATDEKIKTGMAKMGNILQSI